MVYIKKAKKEPLIDEKPGTNIEAKVEGLAKTVDTLLALVERVITTQTVKIENIDTTIESKLPPTIADGLPIPSKWREKINQILGIDFDAEVNESSGGNYMLKIYLPSHLDRRVGVGIRKDRDVSSGLIRRASDVADVQTWCERIASNIKKTYPNFKV